jgi:hypothetical protein
MIAKQRILEVLDNVAIILEDAEMNSSLGFDYDRVGKVFEQVCDLIDDLKNYDNN